MKVTRVFLLLFLALASCQSPPGAVATATQMKTEVTPTPTLTPYWDLLPLTSQPEGGWKTYRNDELNLSFQYPAVYDKGPCGKVWIEDKAWREPPQVAIGLMSITIFVFKNWTDDLAEHASVVTFDSEVQVLSPVEPFSIGGMPALRLIFRNRDQPDTDYTKRAFVTLADRLYEFSYLHAAHVADCDAPPLSEEAIYEYLLSTVEFNQ